MANSWIALEYGDAGAIARIERKRGREYAGPLPPETLEALAEIAEEVVW